MPLMHSDSAGVRFSETVDGVLVHFLVSGAARRGWEHKLGPLDNAQLRTRCRELAGDPLRRGAKPGDAWQVSFFSDGQIEMTRKSSATTESAP